MPNPIRLNGRTSNGTSAATLAKVEASQQLADEISRYLNAEKEQAGGEVITRTCHDIAMAIGSDKKAVLDVLSFNGAGINGITC